MAELNSSPEKAGGKRSRKRPLPRVDLTAMVDLAFLLVTFFMLTTTLAKPKIMEITMPVDEGEIHIPASRTLTVCLGKNNQVLAYLGEADKPILSKMVDFKKDGLRKLLVETGARVQKTSGKDMLVILKPSKHSIYDNLVNALDELNISTSGRYSIVDIAPKDVDLLKAKNAY